MQLYKYLSCENALRALENGLRVTQPDAQNDRKEIRYSFDRDELRRSFELMRTLAADDKTINALLLQGQLLSAVGIDAPMRPDQLPRRLLANVLRNPPAITDGLIDFTREMFDRIRLGIGFISFTEFDKDDLMWAYYGADQTGCVFEFDFPASRCFDLADSIPERFFGNLLKIQYRASQVVPSFDPRTVIDVYITKLSKWAHESEWRSFHVLSGKDIRGPFGKDMRGFDVFTTRGPLEALTGIILGASASAAQVAEFRGARLVGEAGVPVRQFRNLDGFIVES